MTFDGPLINLILAFFMVMARISGLFTVSPFFGGHNIPGQVRVGMALTLGVIFIALHGHSINGPLLAVNLPQLIALMLQEFLIGLILGFAAELLFTGVRMSGEFIAVQMGMSVSGVLDPITGSQSPLMGQVYYMMMFFLLLSLNLHHGFVFALNKSFVFLPIAKGFSLLGPAAMQLMDIGSDMFVLALLVGSPVMGLLLITEVALGFVAKVMPSMNIFMVSLPLKFALGLLAVMASMPYTADLITQRYGKLVKQLMNLYAHHSNDVAALTHHLTTGGLG